MDHFKPKILSYENSFTEAPFFHYSLQLPFMISQLLVCFIILTLSSFVFYGFTILIHTLIFLSTGSIIVFLIRIGNKHIFFNSSWWISSLLLFVAFMPSKLPWYIGFFASPFFLLAANLLLTVKGKIFFNSFVLTFVFIVILYKPTWEYGPNIFQTMPEWTFEAWIKSSKALFFGTSLPIMRENSFLLGSVPSGSLLVLLLIYSLLYFFKIVSFTLGAIYTGTYLLGLFFLSYFFKIPIQAKQNLFFQFAQLFCIGGFLSYPPSPTEFYKKKIYAFLAAVFSCLLIFAGNAYPSLYGILAANLFIPILNIYPIKHWYKDITENKRSKYPWKEIFPSIGMGALLLGCAYMLVR